MKSILAPTDFSKNSENAILYASKLLASRNATIIIVYSFEDSMSGLTSRVDIGKSEQIADQLYAEADEEGERFINSLKQRLGSTEVNFKFIATGMQLFRAVNKIIQQEAIHLTIMGTKGRTADENILVGSTTQKMMHKIKGCPLLVISDHNAFQMPTKIGLATDFKELFVEDQKTAIFEIAEQSNASLHILHVGQETSLTEKQLTIKSKFETLFAALKPSFHYIPEAVQVSEILHQYVEKEQIDFLVLLYRNHNAIVSLFREPVVQKMAQSDTIPILLLQTT